MPRFVCALFALVLTIAEVHADSPVYRVGGNYGMPAYLFLNEAGQPQGFAVDLLAEIGQAEQLRFDYRVTPWRDAAAAVERSEIDIIAGVVPTVERAAVLDFTRPLATFPYVLFVRRDSGIQSVGDLAGGRVAVQDGDAAQGYVRDTWPAVAVAVVADPVEALQGVAASRFAGAVLPRGVGRLLIGQYGLDDVVPLESDAFVSSLSLAVARGNLELLGKLDRGLAAVKDSGRYELLRRRWFGQPAAGSLMARLWPDGAVALAGISLVLGLALAWTASLRRQVARKTRELKAAAERNRMLDELISRSPVVAHVNSLAPGLPFLYVSHNVRRLGYDPQALLEGRVTSRDTIHPDDFGDVVAGVDRHAAAGPDDFTLEYRVMTADGRTVPVENTLHIHRDAVGGPLFVEGLAADISGRRESERALRESIERARLSFQMGPDAILIVRGRDSRIVDVNPSFESLFGWPSGDALGHSPGELSLWAEAGEWSRMAGYLGRNGEIRNLEAAFRTRGGRQRTGLVHAARVAIDDEVHYLVVVRDITEVRHTREQLRKARDELELRVAERTSELECEVTERQYAEKALQEANELLENRVLERTRALEAEVVERRRAERAADLANRAKTEFLATVSHELRTPLNAIIGFSDILAGQLFGPLGRPEYAEYAGDINEAGKHLLSIINDILDVSRLETGGAALDETRLDVPKVLRACRRTMEMRAHDKQIAVTVDAPAGLPALRADERRIRQILNNLLSNAVKFTPSGGRVRLAARLGDDGGFALEVSDTGIGIAPEQMEAVMGTFHQADGSLSRQFDGIGIGLPLSARIAQAHGGTLVLASRLGEGTTVTVRFPPERTVAIPLEAQAVA